MRAGVRRADDRLGAPATSGYDLVLVRFDSMVWRGNRRLTIPRTSRPLTDTDIMLKIDVFNHIFPKPFFERLRQVVVNKGDIKRWLHIPFLHDLDVRFRMLEEFGPDYRQILSLSAPPIESINPDRQITLDLATLANDSMAELVRAHPGRFPGFIASLPLNHADESVVELERAVRDLGAIGVQVFSNVNGLPLDDPRFAPLFEPRTGSVVRSFLHPARGAGFVDYPGEQK